TASLPSFTHPATTEIYTLSLHDALPICALVVPDHHRDVPARPELELLRALRILGPEQARSAGQRRPLRADLGQAHGDAAAATVDHPGAPGHRARARIHGPAAAAGEGSLPALLSEDG